MVKDGHGLEAKQLKLVMGSWNRV